MHKETNFVIIYIIENHDNTVQYTIILQLYQITEWVHYLPYWSRLQLATRPQRHTAPPSGIYLYIATNKK